MYFQKSLAKEHYIETKNIISATSKDEIANWLLTKGFYPESNILPPSFCSEAIKLKNKPYNKDIKDLVRRSLVSISYPKSLLSARVFSIQHPYNYHDMVYYLHENWHSILGKLFNDQTKIYPYSLPIPISKENQPNLSNLRSGRLIYEWVKMAENDLVQDAVNYSFLVKTDITNFYPSIYTHSVAWALEGRDEAFCDKSNSLLGNKIDKLIQYANDARTNGIPIGSALSDLVAELVLCDLDKIVSMRLADLDFVAVRFKDDYRALCKTENDCTVFIKTLAEELAKVNLILNEKKTAITKLPDGLYRSHDRDYFPHSIKEFTRITFRKFEHTLLICLDIHRKYPGTSISEKFLSELLTRKNRIKITFSKHKKTRSKQIKKFVSLILLLKRESEKLISHVLALIQLIYVQHIEYKDDLRSYIAAIIKNEMIMACAKESAFELVWLIFFWRFVGLGHFDFSELIKNNKLSTNAFILSMVESKNKIYSEIELFKPPKKFRDLLLIEYLDVFNRSRIA